MPIFTQSLRNINTAAPQEAIKIMANHIKYIQEQLEYTLTNLDSQHINEIDIDKTTITDSTGSTNIGSFINMSGANGERFTVGKNNQGSFEFTVYGKEKNGKRMEMMYLNSSGDLVITEHTSLTIDGGEW